MDDNQTDPANPWALQDQRPAREPLFNVPWIVVTLCLGLLALYYWQSVTLSLNQENQLSVSGPGLKHGQWQTLITYQFLHGGWQHVIMNTVAALAFATPVARLFGSGPRGTAVFALFYLVCGVLAGLGFAALNLDDPNVALGASGAISGLMGAASRIYQGGGRVGPLFGRTVIAMAVAIAIANVILGLTGLSPGAGLGPIAWQAHLVGYAAGLLLIGPFARLAGRGDVAFTQ